VLNEAIHLILASVRTIELLLFPDWYVQKYKGEKRFLELYETFLQISSFVLFARKNTLESECSCFSYLFSLVSFGKSTPLALFLLVVYTTYYLHTGMIHTFLSHNEILFY